MSPQRVLLYLQDLSRLTDEQIVYAFDRARKTAKFIPSVVEFLEWSMEFSRERQQKAAIERNQQLLDRPAKPEDWNFKLEETFDQLDARAQRLRVQDQEFILTEADHIWPKLGNTKTECRCPKHRIASGGLFWVCYDRIMEAKRGAPLKSTRELSAIFKTLI